MEPGPSVFPTGLPPRQQLPHACFYPLSSRPRPSGPLQVPGRAALSLAQVLALLSCGPDSGLPQWLPPRPPRAKAWQSRRPVLPGWPATVCLRPRGCGLGITSCLLGEAAGISRTNRETAGPCPAPGGELPLATFASTPLSSGDQWGRSRMAVLTRGEKAVTGGSGEPERPSDLPSGEV